MKRRCPTSKFLGIGRLAGFKWMINARGYANIVENGTASSTALVYGAVYSLQQNDEDELDVNEGVPFAYTKEIMSIELWPVSEHAHAVDVHTQPERREMLVYIDRLRVDENQPRSEYIERMNSGIADAVARGMPDGYVRDVIRPFLPENEHSLDGGAAGSELRLRNGV